MKLALIALTLAPVLASAATVEKGGKFDLYIVSDAHAPGVSVVVTTTFETSDSCNHFGLSGAFRPLQEARPGGSLIQKFVADFGVVSTKMACPPSPRKRRITLQSEKLALKPVVNTIAAHILVPENMRVTATSD